MTALTHWGNIEFITMPNDVAEEKESIKKRGVMELKKKSVFWGEVASRAQNN